MMKNAFYILHFALYAAVAVVGSPGTARPTIAATVTPNAASNYLFSTPLRPAHIKGLVMGSPPAYYVPRSEDIDWIEEAAAEREALRSGGFPSSENTVLRPEFGKWDLAATNRFYRWVTAVDAAGVTNVVVGYHLVTNSPASLFNRAVIDRENLNTRVGMAAGDLWNPIGSMEYRYGYLSTNATLTLGAKLCKEGIYTNIYSVAGYTNVWTNATSTISMPMTNGTVSVHTNTWTATKHFPTTFTITNVCAILPFDACHSGDGPFPGYTNAPPLNSLFPSAPVAFSNDYAALRGAVRLADSLRTPTNAPAKRIYSLKERGVQYTNEIYSSYAAITPTPWTNNYTRTYTNLNEASWCDYVFRREHQVWDVTVNYYTEPDEYGNTNIESTVVSEFSIFSEENRAPGDTAVFKTRFTSSLVTTGRTMRVEAEAMYAAVEFQYSNYHITNSEDRVEIRTNVVVRLAGPVLDVSETNATVKVSIDERAICVAAAQAAGAPAPPSSLDGDPGEGRGESWNCDRTGYYIFYRTHPSSKLDGW